jgi:hypothetical protein
VPHRARLAIVEEPVHAPEYAGSLTAHRTHFGHEWQLFEAPFLIQRRPDLVPAPDFDQVSDDEIMTQ